MSDQNPEHLKAGAENTVINPNSETQIKFVNPEADAANELHSVASDIGGTVIGHHVPISSLGKIDHTQFEPPATLAKTNIASLHPNSQKGPVSDTTRWLAKILYGRRARKNAA